MCRSHGTPVGSCFFALPVRLLAGVHLDTGTHLDRGQKGPGTDSIGRWRHSGRCSRDGSYGESTRTDTYRSTGLAAAGHPQSQRVGKHQAARFEYPREGPRTDAVRSGIGGAEGLLT
uniref:Putative secreted protein n=1 Tax=Anopheles darlingi TaxID=43151 RepID=A0A2M4DBM0_ANODA